MVWSRDANRDRPTPAAASRRTRRAARSRPCESFGESFVEQRSDAIEQALALRFGPRLTGRARELFDQLALPRRQLGRHLDLDVHEMIAARRVLARGLRDAATADPKHATGLRALGDPHLDRAIERREIEDRAERGLRERDRMIAVNVGP